MNAGTRGVLVALVLAALLLLTGAPSAAADCLGTPLLSAGFGDAYTAEPGAIRVVTYEDANGNGTRDAGEPLVARAGIQVRDSAGTPVEATIAGATGEPVTLPLAPGEYRVEQIPPAAMCSLLHRRSP